MTRSILDTASDALARTASDLAAASPGSTVSGTTLLAFLADDAFVYPLVSGPTDDQLADFDPFGRRIMAQTLRALADRWDTPPSGQEQGRG